jgi:Ca2+-transporting ATPase
VNPNQRNKEATEWHRREVAELFAEFASSREGLSPGEAGQRLGAYGPNELREKRGRSPASLFFEQFKDLMILVLIGAALVSALIGDLTDSLPIIAIVVINAAVGFVQEYRAEQAMASLRKMASATATVRRGGAIVFVAASELVPGDVVILETGQIVPADIRLIEAARLKVEEAALTGESVPVEKVIRPLGEESDSLGDRRNMVYRGTIVSYGRGEGIVVATGMATELGRIADMLQEGEDSKTPLQRRLARFSRNLSMGAIGICILLFAVGVLRGEAPLVMFMTALTLVVAAIPEALPAVVTISLALAAKKMVRQQALIRKLPAVETLGSVTYICSDKTGTLTVNRMVVEEVYLDGRMMTGDEFRAHRKACADGVRGRCFYEFLRALALSNDAQREASGALIGDPTETALYRFALDHGFSKEELDPTFTRVAEIPFDSDRKCMTTFHRWEKGSYVSFTKGAGESLIEHSTAMLTSGGAEPADRRELSAVAEKMAADGLRVLCIAMREWEELPVDAAPETVERDLVILALVGMMDPPREEVRDAVTQCRTAGIRPVMITGDHPSTARAIARRLGILDDDATEVMTGRELENVPAGEFEKRVEHIAVYARVAPEQKLKIVKALQERRQFVAMTGDGVNDAPALKKADIGIAMGITGTDVAKQAAHMVLLDDNFTTIVKAVREGRRVYDGVTKMVRYILSTNAGEIMLIFIAPLLMLPIPLLPIHILWLNLVTDGLPSLAFASGPPEPDVMARPPRDPRAGILDAGLVLRILWTGFLLAASGIVLQTAAIHSALGSKWQTVVFSFLCFAELGAALALTSETTSFFRMPLGTIKAMLGAVAVTVALQLCVIYIPFMNEVFSTEPLTPGELALTLGVSSVLFFAMEFEKLLRRLKWRTS